MSNGRRSWNRIAIAIGISLALHLVFAAFARSVPALDAAPVEPPFRVTSDPAPRRVRPTPTPPPPPTAPPTSSPVRPRRAPKLVVPLPSPRPAIAHHLVAPALHHTSRSAVALSEPSAGRGPAGVPLSGNGDASAPTAAGVPTLEGSPSIEPTIAPIPPCAHANVPAHVLVVVEPDADPELIARSAGTEAKIRVELSETGAVISAEIAQSTGDARLDEAARLAALHSTYAPEIDACRPRGGSYLFRVDYTG